MFYSALSVVNIILFSLGATALHLCLLFQDCGHINSVHVPKQKNIVNLRQAAVVAFRVSKNLTYAGYVSKLSGN